MLGNIPTSHSQIFMYEILLKVSPISTEFRDLDDAGIASVILRQPRRHAKARQGVKSRALAC